MEQQADHDGQPKLPVHPEQDLAPGSGDLPTYDDLTAQHANQPNSRFVSSIGSSALVMTDL
jgi:hypothetical protein